ncbi:MAG: insulinase family protein [Planctomycetales bacterium]|nr:insulinase family protein [Planctomycetales bacterium]
MIRNLCFALALLGLTLPASAAGPVRVASVEGVNEYQFDNGARVLLLPDPSRPTITINMTVLVGSRHEGYGEAGMAHLLEHLVFKGTPTFEDVPKALRDHGARFNGTTNQDRTNYFETLPANDENLEFAIHMESDRLVNSFISRDDLMSEFTVVRNEFERGENSPQSVLYQRVMSAAYEWHNYGKTTIGNKSDIERVPIDNLQAFYRKYYQPDNVVFIVTGQFDESKALEYLQKYLGSIPKPERKLTPAYTEEPPQDGERKVVLQRIGKVGQVLAAYHMPAASHEDWAPLSLLASMLGEAKVGLLEKVLVETNIATSANASADNSYDPGLFFFGAEPTGENLEQVRATLLETLDGLGTVVFEADQLDRAKIRSQRRNEDLLTDASRMASALSSAAAVGDWRLLFLQRDRLQDVTLEDIQRVAKTYFKAQNRTIGIYEPTETGDRVVVPSVPSILDVVKNYRGKEALAAGEQFDPTPGNIDARTQVVDVNGVQVALLPKSNRGETVTMTLTLRYGNEDSLQDKMVAASMLSGMMTAGTKSKNRQELQEAMDAIGVRIFGGGGGGGRGRRGGGGSGGGGLGQLSFSLSAKRESLVQGIELLGEILREPLFPLQEFEQRKMGTLNGLRSALTEPTSLAAEQLARTLSDYPADDVRYVPSLEEQIARVENVSLEDVVGLYSYQLSAAQGEVAIVGDFEPEPALNALKEILAGWKCEVPYEKIDRDAKKHLEGGKVNISTPDKANALFLAGLSFEMDEDHPDCVALEFANYILGGGTLSSRLGNRIRQQEGLSYGVTSSISIPATGSDARFSINAITNPANMDAVEKAALEELKKFLAEGPTPEELETTKVAMLEAAKVSRSSDTSIAGQLASNLFLGRTFAFTAERESRISELTAEAVKAAFARHINPEKLVIFRAGDL